MYTSFHILRSSWSDKMETVKKNAEATRLAAQTALQIEFDLLKHDEATVVHEEGKNYIMYKNTCNVAIMSFFLIYPTQAMRKQTHLPATRHECCWKRLGWCPPSEVSSDGIGATFAAAEKELAAVEMELIALMEIANSINLS